MDTTVTAKTVSNAHVIWFEDLGRSDVAKVGGKNSSLGEMVRTLGEKGVKVPAGFATTADAYWGFIKANGLKDLMDEKLAEFTAGHATLAETGTAIRQAVVRGEFPEDTAEAIRAAYAILCERIGKPNADVAVRSSATAEDLPDASFAGQQETYLNVRGNDALLD
jgi:pyruvate,water dikinase